jgi:hypothetical protein
MRVWSDAPGVMHHQAGRRLRVFAPVGAELYLMGLPASEMDDEALAAFYRHGLVRPRGLRVGECGQALLAGAASRAPASFQGDPEVARIHGRLRALRAQREAAAPSPASEVEAPAAPDPEPRTEPQAELVRVTAAGTGARLAVLGLAGGPAALGEDGRVVLAPPGAYLITVQVPEDGGRFHDLDEWFQAEPGRRAAGWLVGEGAAKKDARVLARGRARILEDGAGGLAQTGETIEWAEALAASHRAQLRDMLRMATPTRDIPDHLAQHGRLPRTLRGKGNVLYARLPDELAGPRLVTDCAAPRAAQSLLVQSEDGMSVLYAAAGASYRRQEGGPGVCVQETGEVCPLPNSQALRLFAEGTVIEVVPFTVSGIAARAGDATPPASVPTPSPRAETVAPTEGIPDWGDVPPPGDDEWRPEESESSLTESYAEEMGSGSPPSRAGEPGDSEDHAGTPDPLSPLAIVARSPNEGSIHVGNWRDRGLAGLLWVMELLEAAGEPASADGPSELEAVGAGLPISLFRKRHTLTNAQVEALSRAVEALSARIAAVRVYEVDGEVYFGRLDGERHVRLVGPRGRDVRAPEIREWVARDLGRDPDDAYVPLVSGVRSARTRWPDSASSLARERRAEAQWRARKGRPRD